MQLSPTAAPPAPPVPPTHGVGWGIIRAGGPEAPPAPEVVAQAVVELPANFGAHGLIDVSIGARLGTFDSIEAARAAAVELARTRPTVGLVSETRPDGTKATVTAVELLVPDFATVPFEPDPSMPELPTWASVRPTALVLGRDPDPARAGRFVEELWALDQGPEGSPRILEVISGGGHARLEFEQLPGGARRSRLDLSTPA